MTVNKQKPVFGTPTIPPVILIGLDHYLGLQSARIFARHNVPVIGIVRSKKHYCAYTNVCHQILQADYLKPDIVSFLLELGSRIKKKAVLVPGRDVTVLYISQQREKLSRYYHIALPEHKVVEILLDKTKFYRFAQKEGLSIPETFFIKKLSEAREIAEHISYPCSLKPSIKRPDWEQYTNHKAYRVKSPEHFLSLYREMGPFSDVMIAQQWVEGSDANCYACNCYFNPDSKPLVTFVCKTIRKWYPDTGNTSLGQECRNDLLLNQATELFEKVKFHGLGYLEMKMDDRSGKFFIIEPNIGRPTGKAALAEGSGVELLYTMYCDLAGFPLPDERVQKYRGMKWIYLRQDLQSAAVKWRRGEISLKEWYNSLKGPKMFAVFSLRDPLPFIIDFRDRTRANLKKVGRKIIEKIVSPQNESRKNQGE